MANPRKFSEKIALHNQKQAEETARFEQIMREVSDATNKDDGNLLVADSDPLGPWQQQMFPMVQNAISNLEDMKTVRGDNSAVYQERGRRACVGPIRRPNEKRIDTSPYSSGSYLSPPPDTSWRRTNSDSALHQSAMSIGGDSSLLNSGSQRRVTDGQLIMMADPNDPTRKQLVTSMDGRPRSSCEVPRVPGINIYPSQHDPGAVQIPIGNNTGSLPDLTSFHFPSPLPTPLDQEDHSSSPYSTSPQGVSPSTLSPTSLPSRQLGRFSFGNSPQDSQDPSPGHSPNTPRRQYPQPHLQNLVIGGPQSPPNLSQTVNHLSVPSHMNSRYLHTCKGVTVDGTNVQLDSTFTNQFIYQQSQAQQQKQSQQPSPLGSPNVITNSQNMNTHQLNSLSTYRTPQPLTRPSPQTSPSLSVQGSGLSYRSGSPGETSHSGPQSPVSPASSPGLGPSTSPFLDQNNYCISPAQAAQLQQHFEQFTMVDSPVPTSINYIGSPNTPTIYSQAISHGSPDDGLSQVGSQDLSTDHGYYSQSPSQMQYTRPMPLNPSGGSTQQTTPQTPNTPSSIPDIILTDFSSSTGDDLSRPEFVKDLGSAMSGSFDSDLFPSDETLREGLDPIDFDGLQMLTDPDMNVITDPETEDNFRLDRL